MTFIDKEAVLFTLHIFVTFYAAASENPVKALLNTPVSGFSRRIAVLRAWFPACEPVCRDLNKIAIRWKLS